MTQATLYPMPCEGCGITVYVNGPIRAYGIVRCPFCWNKLLGRPLTGLLNNDVPHSYLDAIPRQWCPSCNDYNVTCLHRLEPDHA